MATYTIKDKHGRTWGSFDVSKRYAGKVHGHLKPTSEFKDVSHIFKNHEEAFFSEESDTDDTTAKILQLGAYLVDDKGKEIDINGLIFINENLLVTCELN